MFDDILVWLAVCYGVSALYVAVVATYALFCWQQAYQRNRAIQSRIAMWYPVISFQLFVRDVPYRAPELKDILASLTLILVPLYNSVICCLHMCFVTCAVLHAFGKSCFGYCLRVRASQA